MIVGLVSHGKAFALELTAALAVDPQAIERTVSLAVVLEYPAHVVQHLHDRLAKGERAVYRISFWHPAVGRYIRLLFRCVVWRLAGILFRTICCTRPLHRFVVHRHVIPWTRVRINRCRALLHGLFFRLPMGHWTRANAEICLLAVRGHPKRQAKDVHQVIISHVEEHSKKPDEVRERIERLMGDVPRIELFARQKADGWDVWGNEVINDVELIT